MVINEDEEVPQYSKTLRREWNSLVISWRSAKWYGVADFFVHTPLGKLIPPTKRKHICDVFDERLMKVLNAEGAD